MVPCWQNWLVFAGNKPVCGRGSYLRRIAELSQSLVICGVMTLKHGNAKASLERK